MPHSLLPFTLPLLIILSLTFIANGTFWKLNKPGPIKLGIEKLSHFQFYWHNTQNRSNPTSINIVKPPLNNVSLTTGFGLVNMIDDPLTERPGIESRMLGRAQGFYGQASQKEIGLLMAMNFVFTTRRYNGSTLMVLGRNPVVQKVREMPVIGGTGLFRFARGYVEASTYNLDMRAGNVIVKYHVYVLHY